MLVCSNCKKEVEYTFGRWKNLSQNGLCHECNKRAEEVNASLIYPLKIVSLLEKILEELRSIKNILGYLK